MTTKKTCMTNSEGFDLAKESLRVPELWTLLNLPGEPNRTCCSPFRDESTPSFTIHKDGRKWRDHGANKGGDIFDFYQEATGCSKGEAIKEIYRICNIDIEQTSLPRITKPKKHVIQSKPAPKLELFEPASARLNLDTIHFLIRKGVSPLVVDKLMQEGSIEIESEKLVFVYNTGKKMRCSFETSRDNRWIEGGANDSLWRYPQVLREDVTHVVLCEGETDAMALLTTLGDSHPNFAVVAAPACSWRPNPILCNTIAMGRSVLIAFDNDDAGRDATGCVSRFFERECADWVAVKHFPWNDIRAKYPDKLPVKDISDLVSCQWGQNILRGILDAFAEVE